MFLQLFSCILLYSISVVTSSLTHSDVAHLGTDRTDVDLESAKALFEEFKVNFEKNYEGEEHSQRLEIFIDNVIEFNRRIEESGSTGQIGPFADMTWEEFLDVYGVRMDYSNDTISEVELDPNFVAPEELDWRKQNVVTPVQEQGSCTTCWVFSAIGTLESQYAIKNKKLISLSEKQVLDCFGKTCGGKGSFAANAWKYLKGAGGSMSYAEYPYVAQVGNCQFNPQKVVARVESFKGPTAMDEEKLKGLVASYGPVSIGMRMFPQLQHTIHGVIEPSPSECDPNNGHAMVVVGYGTEQGKPYWLIKNSFGTNWGENGYFKLIRGRNICRFADQVIS